MPHQTSKLNKPRKLGNDEQFKGTRRNKQTENQEIKTNNRILRKNNKIKNTSSISNGIPLTNDYWTPVPEATVNFLFSPRIAFQVIFGARMISAMWLHITDCDETYQCWEASHYILFKSGFQPWEYAPQFAIRSWFYVLIYTLPLLLYRKLFHYSSRLFLFYLLRCILGLICTACEVSFYKAVSRQFGINVGRITLVILLFSPGMYIASTAFLPSSTSMYMTFLFTTAWFYGKYPLAIFCIAFSSLVCWPFSALIGVPFTIEMVFLTKRFREFVKWSTLSALIILPPQIFVDSNYYGRLTITSWNIVKYNLFSPHGPNLYGTLPWDFYLKNSFANFNISFCLALLSPILLISTNLLAPKKAHNSDRLPYYLTLGGLFLWLGVFNAQPHKEERFLFPVYPLIALCGAVSIDAIQQLWFRYFISKEFHYTKCTLKIVVFLLFCNSALGISRMICLYKNYYAPMAVFTHPKNIPVNVTGNAEVQLCTSNEWHMFPSSFFLPDRWKLDFFFYDFHGQFPAHYLPDSDASAIDRLDMNDEDRMEPSRFVDINICDYIIKKQHDHSNLPPIFYKNRNWTVVYSAPYLDPTMTPLLVRNFYIPVISELHTHFYSFNLLKSNQTDNL